MIKHPIAFDTILVSPPLSFPYPLSLTLSPPSNANSRKQKKIKRKEYPSSNDFAADIELVFSNALAFNEDHSAVWEAAINLKVRSFFALFSALSSIL
jgi:hypothetical protein